MSQWSPSENKIRKKVHKNRQGCVVFAYRTMLSVVVLHCFTDNT